MNMNNSYSITAADRKRRAKEEAKREAQRAERRKELERLVRGEDARRRERRLSASA